MSESRLLCSVYKSSKKSEMYVYIEKKKGLDVLPEALLAFFGTPIHVFDMLLTEEKKLARVDAKKVLAEIAEKGFLLQMPPVEENYLPGFVEFNKKLKDVED
ncbi:YcgL domain-containing protein [Alkalimarinus coralli]|uniref:YcgL domain-containing protein n=1 Tax=Alkalimarinus coralli TaxID=2935863 RepID=UPI00202B5282|nr:YcgL domain-containing protein [Alkalimarinus coralli]